MFPVSYTSQLARSGTSPALFPVFRRMIRGVMTQGRFGGLFVL